jgi:WD40 repeat protein
MKIAIYTFILLVGLCACQANSQIATTSTPGSHVAALPTATPTIFFPPTNTPTATVTPTNTPLSYSTPFHLPPNSISPENIEDLQELAILGKGKINNFRYSPDGKLLVVATTRGIYIYDAQTFLEKKYIPTDDSVNCLAFSPDGATIASTFRRGAVRLWQLSSGELLDTLENNTGYSSSSLLFSPDGSLLFSASGDHVIRAWQISDGKLLRTFRGAGGYSADEMVDSISISPDGSLLATTDGYERVWVWRTSTSELLQRLEGGHVAFSPNGEILAVAKGYFQDDQLVTLWQVSDWTSLNTISSPDKRILNIVFSPDGETLLINNNHGETQLWNIPKHSVSTCFLCGENYFEVMSFSANGANITTLDQDGVLQVWNASDASLLHTFDEHVGAIASLAFSKDGQFLAASSASSASIWQIPNSLLLNRSTYKSYNYLSQPSMAFSPDNKFLVFNPFLEGLHVWSVASPNPPIVWDEGKTISSLAFSSDGTVLAIGLDNTVEFRRFPDGTLLDTLNPKSSQSADTMAYSQDAQFLALAQYNKVEIWRLSDKSLDHTLKGIGYSINQVAFSSAGNIFATGTFNTAQWNGSDGRQLQSLPIHGHAFPPDLGIVAEIEYPNVRFYRMSDGKLIKTLKFNYSVHDVEFASDGKLVAIAGDDGTINIWGIR